MTYTTDRKTSYYLSKISDNIGETPEGYLICKNVPIARTGVQEYLGQEIQVEDRYDKEVNVYREEEDVFDEAAIASFEGKPLTDEHPPVQVNINNLSQYAKGHVQNVHRCTSDPTLLVADLVVQDPVLIEKIKNKVKREISCGYDSYYVPYKDGYKQFEIRGNHIALVTKGRAGSRVSIQDNLKERKKPMAKKSILASMLKAFAKDADPDEVAEAIDAINQRDADEEKAKILETLKKKEKTREEDEDPMASLTARLDSLEEKLAALNSKSTKDEEGKEEEDETFNKKIEEDDDAMFCQDEDPEDEEEEDGEEEKVTISKDSMMAIRSAVAKIRSPRDRKRTADALSKVFGRSTSKGVYGKINKIATKTKDSVKESQSMDYAELGKQIAAKYNPHYMENK